MKWNKFYKVCVVGYVIISVGCMMVDEMLMAIWAIGACGIALQLAINSDNNQGE